MTNYRDLFEELARVKQVEPVAVEVPSPSITLRPYQRESVDATFAEWAAGYRSTLIQLPTGTGKSVVFSEVMRRSAGKRILLLAHRRELIEQAKQHAINAGLTAGIEMGVDRVFEQQVVCSSVQTQVSKQHCRACAKHGCEQCDNRGWWYRFERFKVSEFGLVVIDEAHHSAADTYRRVVNHYLRNPACNLLGVTATPRRGDGIGLWSVFDKCSYQMEIGDAVADGWLVPVQEQSITVHGLDLTRVKTNISGDLADGALERAFLGGSSDEEYKMLHSVAGPLVDIARGKPTLLFSPGVEHAQKITMALNSYDGISAECVLGSTDALLRSEIFKRYKSGATNVLVNVGVATEGFDAPSTAVVGIARPTNSIALYMQMIGRGTRPLPGVVDGPESASERIAAIAASAKPNCRVVSFCGDAGKHKLISMVDVLAGDEPPELQEEMRAESKASGEPLAVEELKRRVEEARQRRLEREEQLKKERQLQGDGYRAVNLEYTTDVYDLYGDSQRSKAEDIWEQRTGDVTEKQYKLLLRLGVSAEKASGFSKRQAGIVIDSMGKGTGKEYRITFGKHAGKKLGEVPKGYLRWLAENNIGKASLHAKEVLGIGRQHATVTDDAPF